MNRRGFLKNLGLASIGLTIAGNLVLPAFSAPIGKRVIFIGDMWYDIDQYKLMKLWEQGQ